MTTSVSAADYSIMCSNSFPKRIAQRDAPACFRTARTVALLRTYFGGISLSPLWAVAAPASALTALGPAVHSA